MSHSTVQNVKAPTKIGTTGSAGIRESAGTLATTRMPTRAGTPATATPAQEGQKNTAVAVRPATMRTSATKGTQKKQECQQQQECQQSRDASNSSDASNNSRNESSNMSSEY